MRRRLYSLNVEDRVLGFDVRERWLSPPDLWDAERRERFLVRVDVSKPLSVDTMVWPSVFDTGQGIGMPQSERERLHLAGIPLPSWIGPNAGLWDDLARMRRYLDEHGAEPRPYAVVAVSWFSEDGFADAGQVGPYLAPVAPPQRAGSWRFLGFDVADGSLVSALSNCGLSLQEARVRRRRWRSRLNSVHLFDELRYAFQFRDVANKDVPEHAPFLVYGLFIVEGVG